MKIIKNWIIEKLGRITSEEFEKNRSDYEKWAIENLAGKNGEITPDCYFYKPFDGDNIIVIRSNISIMNGRISGLKVAPWCKNVICQNLTHNDRDKRLIGLP